MATLADVRRAADGDVDTGADALTPNGTFYATARVLGIITSYLMDGLDGDPDATILGRIEYPPAYGTARPTMRIYRGGGTKGGEFTARQMGVADAYLWMIGR